MIWTKRAGRGLVWLLLAVVVLLVLLCAFLWWRMEASVPQLEGELTGVAVSAPVTVARDAAGMPTITAATRADAAWALGFLHGQERFFQMDTLRRAAAGELGGLVGANGLKLDRVTRVHRFRARARLIVAGMAPEERALLNAYVAGVNRGLGSLKAAPFEYALLFRTPAAWRDEDTILTVFAMYMNLQPALPMREMDRARAMAKGGVALADLLYPLAGSLDAPIDGSRLPEVPLPAALKPLLAADLDEVAEGAPEAVVTGSNNWAVAGRLSSSGAALVANDMHLGLGVPSIWYRARLVVNGRPAVTGVTLPGAPLVVAGSNGRIAWGYTNSYIDTADAVVVQPDPDFADRYRTPDGGETIVRVEDQLCARDVCEPFVIEETIWGPVVGTDAFGRKLAMRWTAHERDAIRLSPSLALETAGSVAEAVAIAHKARIPQQNFTVGDSAGNIAWTIIGAIPARYGFNGQDAVSFADGSRGWRGILPPEATPVVMNPANGRIWTANSRVVGGAAHALLGDGGYDTGARAGRIRDRLLMKQRFTPEDFLSIQLDDVNVKHRWWQALLLRELEKRKGDAKLAALIAPVRDWGERAVPAATGYRFIGVFRDAAVKRYYRAWVGEPEKGGMRKSYAPSMGEVTLRRVLEARTPALLPAGDVSWDQFIDRALAEAMAELDAKAGGDITRFTWGAVGRAGVQHPLAKVIAPLGWVTDPRDVAVPGDRATVRAQAPGFGASERFAVSPGHETQALFQMGGGQAGNPRAPYYLAGHEAWVKGTPAPFLPGPARWTLTLQR
ncbi:penicillin acylase family protein [Sandaracinobacteroides saxicola]|uniref:Penicillin acylase family protein n=1 Tax=Sandaracinobacteroides saxicola TaxID=2759707 RepID=A0A7G5IJP2_9SPHN|nr:penicillin acylase family protein [Sandaracinobacteroides saxicola]QMW23584.1 penicillin acylase family protein [Sandaracinobacteroides saxicola]